MLRPFYICLVGLCLSCRWAVSLLKKTLFSMLPSVFEVVKAGTMPGCFHAFVYAFIPLQELSRYMSQTNTQTSSGLSDLDGLNAAHPEWFTQALGVPRREHSIPVDKGYLHGFSWGPVSYTHLTLPTNREV